jgi:hypothetical protein
MARYLRPWIEGGRLLGQAVEVMRLGLGVESCPMAFG